MRKLILLILFGGLILINGIKLADAVTPTETVVDYECYQAKVLEGKVPTSIFASTCSIQCDKACLYKVDPTSLKQLRQNSWCKVGTAGAITCETSTTEIPIGGNINNVNFLGIDTDRFLLIAVRRVMLGVLGAAGIIIIAVAIYAMYKFSFADGNQEKMQEAIKIFKSLIVGALITSVGVSAVQIAALLSGVTGNLLDFDFIPKSGRVVVIFADDVGKKCLPEQTPVVTAGVGAVTCDPITNTWKQ